LYLLINYKDVIKYQLSDDISEQELIEIATKVANNWMKYQPGFIKWEIHCKDNNNFIDIVSWTSKEYARRAKGEVAKVPGVNQWYACYKQGSISTTNLTLLADFEFNRRHTSCTNATTNQIIFTETHAS
jgi:hypothetical protein